MDTSDAVPSRPATVGGPVLLGLDETGAVGAGVGPVAGAFVAGVATGAAVAVASFAAGAAVAAAGVAVYTAATSSDSGDKEPVIAPGT